MKKRSGLVQTLWQALAILAIAVAAAALTKWLHPQAPAWYRVEDALSGMYRLTVAELRQRYSPEQLLWIDARPKAQFEKAHLAGARPLTEEDWANQTWDLRSEFENLAGRAVVVYCDGKSCQRSAAIAERLRGEVGLETVWVLRGDWRDWDNP